MAIMTVSRQTRIFATIASRLRVRRLKSVDLPTFGRPTRTRVGFMIQALVEAIILNRREGEKINVLVIPAA